MEKELLRQGCKQSLISSTSLTRFLPETNELSIYTGAVLSKAAAKELAFERAAELRNQIRALRLKDLDLNA